MSSDRIHVVAGAIVNRAARVLIAKRPLLAHQGGRWEFPGGKVQPGEAPRDALERELLEEIGIRPTRIHPLIKIPYDYGERRVLLEVWRVEDWTGDAHGAENQPIEWRPLAKLDAREFPAANRPVITALKLPSVYLITPDPATTPDRGLSLLRQQLGDGITLVQLRSRALPRVELRRLVREAAALCKAYGAALLVNDDPRFVQLTEADGVHLTSERLMRLAERPLDEHHWVAASCHDSRELEQACRIGVDFAVLSPVAPTRSHPHAHALGWERFAAMVERVPIPVFALGGMRPRDVPVARSHRAQGIAGISAFFGPEPGMVECERGS